MMEKSIEFIGLAMIVVGLCVIVVPLYYWANNPELSQMQVFIATWKTIIIGFVIEIAGVFIYKR